VNIQNMKTPIYDFVQNYANSDFSRFHMPGHKGRDFTGFEKFDITEISGADVLYMSDGIIKESEENASSLFYTAKTFYSTEGSSHTIRAMLGAVASLKKGNRPLVLAARNVHKAFIYACAALDIDVQWIYPKEFNHLCSCEISAADVEETLRNCEEKPDAIYITSPDYIGNVADVSAISNVCEAHNILLLVDNAHGAYLNFLPQNLQTEYSHPIKQGAHICCDSAHKTLPVLTGGAYLHFSDKCPKGYITAAQKMLRVFATTSPSYLVLQSLDLCNKYLSEHFLAKLEKTVKNVMETKEKISSFGYFVEETEPLKIVVNIKEAGYSAEEFTKALKNHKIVPEMCDDDFVVLMASTENCERDFERLGEAFGEISLKKSLQSEETAIKPSKHIQKISIREAVFAPHKTLAAENSVGEICGAPTVSCPPAVPVVISGEVITEQDAEFMKKYGIDTVDVVDLQQHASFLDAQTAQKVDGRKKVSILDNKMK